MMNAIVVVFVAVVVSALSSICQSVRVVAFFVGEIGSQKRQQLLCVFMAVIVANYTQKILPKKAEIVITVGKRLYVILESPLYKKL